MKKLLLLTIFGLLPIFAHAQINKMCPQFTANGIQPLRLKDYSLRNLLLQYFLFFHYFYLLD